MLMRGSGSGIREPLKANSRGKVLDLSVEIAIFSSPKSGWDGDWVIVTMIRSSITAVALVHEVQGISSRPRSALGEAPKIRAILLLPTKNLRRERRANKKHDGQRNYVAQVSRPWVTVPDSLE